MLGSLRLFLAVVVVYYHAGVSGDGFHTGVAAVGVFFMVSGYAMTGLVDRHRRARGGVGAFYLDRALRILPQYYVHLGFYAAVVATVGRSAFFQPGEPTAWVVTSYVTVLPLSWAGFSPELSSFILIPQAWSLGTELSFYILFPLFARAPGRAMAWAAACFAVFVLATHGVIDRDAFSYRLPPGSMLLFMLGHFLYRRDGATVGLVLAGLAVNLALLGTTGAAREHFNLELHAAAFAGTAAVAWLGPLRSGRLDDTLGAASYGCYLVHFAFDFIADALVWPREIGVFAYASALAALSVVSGYLTHRWVERPFTSLRRSLREGALSRIWRVS